MANGKSLYYNVKMRDDFQVNYSQSGYAWATLKIYVYKKDKQTNDYYGACVYAKCFGEIAEELGKLPAGTYIDVECNLEPEKKRDRTGKEYCVITPMVKKISPARPLAFPKKEEPQKHPGFMVPQDEPLPPPRNEAGIGFMDIPDGFEEDEGLPFS